jgi:hypothetical protein
MSQIISKSNSKRQKAFVYKIMKSPVGELKLVASDQGLAAILWENDNPKRVRLNIVGEDRSHPVLLEFRGPTQDLYRRAGFRRHRFPEKSMAGPARHSVRPNPQLWRNRQGIGQRESDARGRCGERKKSHFNHRSLPQGHRVDRATDWLRGRLECEGQAFGTGVRRPGIFLFRSRNVVSCRGRSMIRQ